jgi:ATP-binding cassette subfamily C (CFTR/MRP) protein 1
LTIIGDSTQALAPLGAFTVFVIAAKSSGRTLNTASAYTALSLVSLLAEPMNSLSQALPALIAALACFARIETFLKSDARRDHRLQATIGFESDNIPLVSPRNGDIQMGVIQSSRTSTEGSQNLLSVQDASFAWTKDGPSAVHDVSFHLQRHKFSFLIGPVGSGKSTLLKGLLGETPSVKGFVYSTNLSTAFVDQSPWIRNGTIRENILGISVYDEPWYNQVVHVCALEGDISILPKGHGKLRFTYELSKLMGSRNTCRKCWHLSQWWSETTSCTC